MWRLACCGILGLALLACSDDSENPPTPDGGSPDGVVADLQMDQVPAEAGTPDQSGPDGPSSVCDPALDLSPLTLDSAYCVARRFEIPAKTNAVGLQGDLVYLFTLNSESGGIKGHVQQGPIDPQSGTLGTLAPVFSFTPASSATLFAGAYLALSPSAFAAVGYTEDQTFAGEILWGDKGIKAPKLIDQATGNFDAVFLDDTTLLVNGTGLGTAQDGQGVYLYQVGQTPRRLITDMGVASGFMALGPSVLFAGGYFSSGSKIYGFSLFELKQAINGGTTLSSTSDGDLIYQGSAGDAVAVGDDLLLTTLDSSWQMDAVVRVPVTAVGAKVTAGTAEQVVTVPAGADATVSALAAGGAGPALVLQGTAKTELAVIVEP